MFRAVFASSMFTAVFAMFDCGDKALNFSQLASTTLTKENCCREKLCSDFDCGRSYDLEATKLFEPDPSQEKCCVLKDMMRCEEWTCAEGNQPIVGEDSTTEATESKCCKKWVPSCYMYTKLALDPPYDIFPCKTGTTLNISNYASENPSQAVCCMDFEPTCRFASGSVLNQERYSCGSGKTFNLDNVDEPASVDKCCTTHVPTCKNPQGDLIIFQCPSGKVYNSDNDQETSPDETKCCQEETCGKAQFKCGDLGCDTGHNLIASRTNTQVLLESESVSFCCEISEIKFSGALSAGVSSISLFVFLILSI